MQGNIVNNEYIDKTLKFIKKSDLRLRFTNYRDVNLLPNGNQQIKMSSFSSLSLNEISGNRLLAQMVIFSLIDSFIDFKYPSLEGLSFKKRYNNLPSSNDGEIIFKEAFRLLKIMRNAFIHSRSSISTPNNDMHIQYQFKNTTFKLQCSSEAIEWMHSFLILYISRNGVGSAYVDAIWRSYYDKFIAGIQDFSDEFMMPLQSISPGIRLKIVVRYRINNPEYHVSDDGAFKFNKYIVDCGYERFYGADYLFERQGHQFIIPDEALDDYGRISSAAIEEWE